MPLPRALFLQGLLVALTSSLPLQALGAGPADRLLKLVPSDAGVTLAVEDLRGHARALLASPLAEDLRRLPVVRSWQESEGCKAFRRSLERVEALLGTDVDTLRDALLGEAVVLSLRLAPGAGPDEARGLLLAKVTDRPLLDRLIDGLNAAQKGDGELLQVSDRRRNGFVYHVREFKPGMRVNEYYAVFGDGIFAWSNSEALVQGVVDRKAGGAAAAAGSLGDDPAFRTVRDRLPDRAAVSLFVNPRFAERAMAASPRPEKPQDQRVADMIAHYLAALKYAGAALSWQGGPVIHTEELVDPSKLAPSLSRWAARPAPTDPRLTRVPDSALAFATAPLDFVALLDGLKALTPDEDRPRYETLMLALRGGLLGLDPRDEVAPHLGPGVSGYLERPDPRGNDGTPSQTQRLNRVLTVQVASTAEGARVAAAVDNALRTLLALCALDPKNGGGRLRVETRTEGGTVVTFLRGPKPLAYAVHEGRIILSNTPDAVGRALAAQADPKAAKRLESLHARGMPGASTFAFVDLRALYDFADPIRPALAQRLADRQKRPEAEASRDLDQALALARLFDAAYFTSTIDPAFTRVHRTLGFLTRAADTPDRP